jgi:capsular polysaccharide export protein
MKGVNPWALLDVVRPGLCAGGRPLDLARLAGCEVDGSSEKEPEALFRRRFLEESVYLDAWTRQETDFLSATDQLAWQRDRFLENERRSYCVGVSRWKAEQVARFLDAPDGPAVMEGSDRAAVTDAAVTGGRIVAWETRMPARLEAACAEAGVPLLRMEDGFLRSVGLGAAFLPGASCVLDGRGIYYDPRRESDLEHILGKAEFGPDLLARAAALRREVVALRLTKYNVGRASPLDDLPRDRPLVLVPGQVEDDASVLLGSPNTPTNLALLQATRRNNPDAFLIFKPHPDVEAGLRRGRLAPDQTAGLADRVIGDVAIVDLLDRVDSIETMTSLAGFEALLRGRRTVVHGQPFYGGWGLTTDLDPPARRTRRLSLDELVAGALILYPRYVDPVTGQRCPPEVLVRRLAEARDAARHTPASKAAARAAYVRARHALLTPIGQMLRRMRGAVRSPARGPDRP